MVSGCFSPAVEAERTHHTTTPPLKGGCVGCGVAVPEPGRAKPLRDSMPTVAAWIDELREAFGADSVNASIKAGMAGQPMFWASERGQEVGCRAAGSVFSVSGDALGVAAKSSKSKGAVRG